MSLMSVQTVVCECVASGARETGNNPGSPGPWLSRWKKDGKLFKMIAALKWKWKSDTSKQEILLLLLDFITHHQMGKPQQRVQADRKKLGLSWNNRGLVCTQSTAYGRQTCTGIQKLGNVRSCISSLFYVNILAIPSLREWTRSMKCLFDADLYITQVPAWVEHRCWSAFYVAAACVWFSFWQTASCSAATCPQIINSARRLTHIHSRYNLFTGLTQHEEALQSFLQEDADCWDK